MDAKVLAAIGLEKRQSTVEGFFTNSPLDEKADLIDGVAYITPLDTLHENDLRGFLSAILGMYIDARRIDGHVFGCRVAFMFASNCVIEPDLAYLTSDRTHLIGHDRVHGPPDLAIEIVSDETRTMDLLVKKQLYATNGVREFLAVDPILGNFEVCRQYCGGFRPLPLDGGIYRSQVIPGFWLDSEWLLSTESPNLVTCLGQILAS